MLVSQVTVAQTRPLEAASLCITVARQKARSLLSCLYREGSPVHQSQVGNGI